MKRYYFNFFTSSSLIAFFLALAPIAKAADLSSEFVNLPCVPTNSANLNISGGPTNLYLQLGTSLRDAGAIATFKVNGREIADDTDHGRQIQYAFQHNGQGEANNPTEAGSSADGSRSTSTSAFLEGCSSGKTLYTKSQMAYWYPLNGAGLSPFILSKLVTIGVGNIPNLIRFVVKIHSPAASQTWQLETPTGYQTADFTQLSLFDLLTNTVRVVAPTEFTHLLGPGTNDYLTPDPLNLPIISNGTISLTPYMPQLAQYIPTYPGRYFYANFYSQSVSKWSIFTYKNPDYQPNDYYYESYLLVSPNTNVVNDIKTMLIAIPPTPTDRPATGNVDSVSQSGLVSGWVSDPDVGDGSIDVHFYLDGTAGNSSSFIGSTKANMPRQDVFDAKGFGRYSGFQFQIPVSKINDGKPHTLYVYGIGKDPSGSLDGFNPLINPPNGTATPIYMSTYTADLNNDGKVDIYDYNIIVQNFGHPYTIFDYNQLVGNFGK